MKSDLTKLQRILNYTFNDPHLLVESVTHRSFAAEHGLNFNNQRLEFLGDSVMQIILTEFVYWKYPQYAEGMLTKIRSAMADQPSFARLARLLSLGEFIMLGKGEIENDGANRDSTLSDAFEAVVAAIFVDSNLDRTREVVMRVLNEAYPDPVALLNNNNPKGALQEYAQHTFGMSPRYTTIAIDGEDHDPVFTVQVELNEVVLATSSARKRKIAEGMAASEALTLLKEGKIEGFQGQSKS